jgi:hypothetical protein
MPTVYSYQRFSTDAQRPGHSLTRQHDLALAYARKHGLGELDERLTYRDRGVRAFDGSNKASGKLGLFLKAIQQGEVKPGDLLLVPGSPQS